MPAGVPERVRLARHPQSGGTPALGIEVEVARDASTLMLTYIVSGDIAAVVLPKHAKPSRADGLWQHTCFEAFVRNAQSRSYWEFNFSPSHQWAAYRFSAYREGMAAEPAIVDAHIELHVESSELRLAAALDVSGIAALSTSDAWWAGLSAVVDDENGEKSYWALAHSPGKPDFHDQDSFVLAIRPETRRVS